MTRALRALLFSALWLAGGCREPVPPASADAAAPPRRDAGSLLQDASSGPRRPDGGPRLPPADVEIVLPFGGEPQAHPLAAATSDVGRLDVFFSVDTTASFTEEIATLQEELTRRILPGLRARSADAAFGVGRFEDFPVAPFGQPGDHPFRLVTGITTDEARVRGAVRSLDDPLGHGGDIPEAGAEALYQIATGAGLPPHIAAYDRRAAPGGGTEGGVGFRPDSVRVVIHVTDAPTHLPADYEPIVTGTRDIPDAIAALQAIDARVIGIASGVGARGYLEAFAVGTGAVAAPRGGRCPTGIEGEGRPPSGGLCPLVFDIRPDGSGLADAMLDAVGDLLDSTAYREVWAEADDPLGFVRALEAGEALVTAGVEPPTRVDRRAPEGVLDTFLDVPSGAELRFVARLENQVLPPADYEQIFVIPLRIVGDGAVLTTERLRVIVPAGRLDAGTGDAGAQDAGGAGDDAGGVGDAGDPEG